MNFEYKLQSSLFQELLNTSTLFDDGDWVESKDQDPDGKVRLIQLADIGDGQFLNKSKRFMNIETARKLNCTFIRKNDILIARMPDPLGRCCLFPFDEDEKYVTVVDIAILRIKSNYSQSYIQYIINTPQVRHVIEGQTTGTTRKRITRKKLEKLRIPLPALAEQQKIASILDAADSLRQKDQQLIEKYTELSQSLFLDMFGDPVSNPMGWQFSKLNDVVTKLGDGLHGTPVYSEQGEYYFINGNNLHHGVIEFTSTTKTVSQNEFVKHKKELNSSTMLVSINGTIGKVAFYNGEKIVLGKSACYFNVNELLINKAYLFYLIEAPYFIRYALGMATGSTIKNVSLKTMRGFPVSMPPITLQNQFAERIQAIEAQKQQAQTNLQKSADLFNSLLQRAFKGELT